MVRGSLAPERGSRSPGDVLTLTGREIHAPPRELWGMYGFHARIGRWPVDADALRKHHIVSAMKVEPVFVEPVFVFTRNGTYVLNVCGTSSGIDNDILAPTSGTLHGEGRLLGTRGTVVLTRGTEQIEHHASDCPADPRRVPAVTFRGLRRVVTLDATATPTPFEPAKFGDAATLWALMRELSRFRPVWDLIRSMVPIRDIPGAFSVTHLRFPTWSYDDGVTDGSAKMNGRPLELCDPWLDTPLPADVDGRPAKRARLME